MFVGVHVKGHPDGSHVVQCGGSLGDEAQVRPVAHDECGQNSHDRHGDEKLDQREALSLFLRTPPGITRVLFESGEPTSSLEMGRSGRTGLR